MPQMKKHSSAAEKQQAYRDRKRNEKILAEEMENALRLARQQVVLSLFPGADLFGRAFESLGFCVVRGPERLLGGDIRDFHAPQGAFHGVIGGPPCQPFSRAAHRGSAAPNLIPEFVRLLDEARPGWAVMENLYGALPATPDWPYVALRDWDCGGKTHRRRIFWFVGVPAAPSLARQSGEPEWSVLASSWNKAKPGVTRHSELGAQRAAELQGFPGLGDLIYDSQPGQWCSNNKWRGVSGHSRNVLAVHMLGNGVPFAMGLYVASWVLACQTKTNQPARLAQMLRNEVMQ